MRKNVCGVALVELEGAIESMGDREALEALKAHSLEVAAMIDRVASVLSADEQERVRSAYGHLLCYRAMGVEF